MEQYDPETGVVHHAYWDVHQKGKPGRPPRGEKQPEFFRVYRENWLDIVRNKRLTVTETGLLMKLLAFLGWESTYLVHPETGKNLSVSEVADILGMDRAHVHALLQSLNDKGMVALVKLGRGRPNHIKLNSHVVFFGKYLRDLKEHHDFDGDRVAYRPVRPVHYREPPNR